jgi:EVE domain
MTAPQNWIAVASAEHVRWGRKGGYMQVCHGKRGPLARVQPGDGVVYYSPTEVFRGPGKLQAFTAIGRVKDSAPYAFDMGGGFVPFRRDVDWFEAQESPILPLLDQLEFSAGRRNWGYQLRFGLFSISARDFGVIADAMVAALLDTAEPAGTDPIPSKSATAPLSAWQAQRVSSYKAQTLVRQEKP